MTNEDVVRALWTAFDVRDFERAASLLHPDFICDWPQSNERIRGVTNFIAVNKFYPGQWQIKVVRVVSSGAEVVTEVEVTLTPPAGEARLDHAVSFFTLHDSKIAHVREYWPEPYPAPDWRAQWVEILE